MRQLVLPVDLLTCPNKYTRRTCLIIKLQYVWEIAYLLFFSIRPPPGLLPVLGPLERYMMPTLDSALLISSRAGADLGRTSDHRASPL